MPARAVDRAGKRDTSGDPQKLGLKLCKVNGVLKQVSNTSDMIFNLAERRIEQLSAGMTLYPGDLILTGTPASVGTGRGEFLKAGDVGEALGREGRTRSRTGWRERPRPTPLTTWQGTGLCPSRAVLVCVNSMGPDRRLSPVQTI